MCGRIFRSLRSRKTDISTLSLQPHFATKTKRSIRLQWRSSLNIISDSILQMITQCWLMEQTALFVKPVSSDCLKGMIFALATVVCEVSEYVVLYRTTVLLFYQCNRTQWYQRTVSHKHTSTSTHNCMWYNSPMDTFGPKCVSEVHFLSWKYTEASAACSVTYSAAGR